MCLHINNPLLMKFGNTAEILIAIACVLYLVTEVVSGAPPEGGENAGWGITEEPDHPGVRFGPTLQRADVEVAAKPGK